MATPSQKKSHTGKITLAVLVLFIVGLVGFGYYSQTSSLNSTQAAEPAEEKTVTADPSDPIFLAGPNDIVIGDANAPATILDYSSLSCPHCAHFHLEVLPQVKKELIDTGKAKLVFRHFPLNEPALRAAQLVECSGVMKREAILKALFETQKNWAFSENFKADLKIIAQQGGIDAAAFDSCLADKALEDAILETRQAAATKAGVNSTPSFFVNGKAVENFTEAKGFTDAVNEAAKPAEAAVAPTPQTAAPAAAAAPQPAAESPAKP